MLRREVSRRIGLRFAPELTFDYDDGQDDITRIEALLEEMKAERKPAHAQRCIVDLEHVPGAAPRHELPDFEARSLAVDGEVQPQ